MALRYTVPSQYVILQPIFDSVCVNMKWFKWVLLTALAGLVTLIRNCNALSLLVTKKMHNYMLAVNVKPSGLYKLNR